MKPDILYDAILFSHANPLPDVIEAIYRLQINEFNGSSTLQFILEHWFQPVPDAQVTRAQVRIT